MSLGARHIEAAGISTVVIGSARDIVEECGVARFCFVDFPLGNPCGKPSDTDMQRIIAGLALDLLEQASVARTTVQAPFVWDEADDGWRERFMHVGDDNRAELAAAGLERRSRQEQSRESAEDNGAQQASGERAG